MLGQPQVHVTANAGRRAWSHSTAPTPRRHDRRWIWWRELCSRPTANSGACGEGGESVSYHTDMPCTQPSHSRRPNSGIRNLIVVSTVPFAFVPEPLNNVLSHIQVNELVVCGFSNRFTRGCGRLQFVILCGTYLVLTSLTLARTGGCSRTLELPPSVRAIVSPVMPFS